VQFKLSASLYVQVSARHGIIAVGIHPLYWEPQSRSTIELVLSAPAVTSGEENLTLHIKAGLFFIYIDFVTSQLQMSVFWDIPACSPLKANRIFSS
jgi:hypothetical protein